MSFGLKNARATYQRLVDKVFHDQISRNLEAYVDDIVIKSMSEEEMLVDIKETFEKFRSNNMKLNPKKCSFSVEEGPFLGHLITKLGIRANSSKIKAITDIEQLKTLKDIRNNKQQSRVRSTIGQFVNITRDGNYKLGNIHRFTVVGKSNKRNQNKKADALSKLASMTFEHLTKEVLVEVLSKRSIEEKEILQVETKEEKIWMTPIHKYLVSGLLPEDPKEARKIKKKGDTFILTYGFEAIIPISKNNVAKDDKGRIKEVNKGGESRKIASIKEAYYRNKLRRHHNKRSSHSTYKIGDFILLLQNNTEITQVWQGLT
nr:reverse transcriptase domain-containing protein [Tanacetum cinerariifolium]